MAPVGASDTAPNKTAGMAPDRHFNSDNRLYALIDFLPVTFPSFYCSKQFFIPQFTARLHPFLRQPSKIATRDLRMGRLAKRHIGSSEPMFNVGNDAVSGESFFWR
jgi:hypothetical protein